MPNHLTQGGPRWWSVKYGSQTEGGYKNVLRTVYARNEAQARIAACPRKSFVFKGIKPMGRMESTIEAIRAKGFTLVDVYGALGDAAALLKVGVGIESAILLQTPKVKSPRLRYYLIEVASRIKEGMSVPQAFALYPEVADKQLLAIMSVGEETGKLDEVFRSMKEFQTHRKNIGGKVRIALIVPALVFAVASLMLLIFSHTIIPKMEQVFRDFNAEIPAVSKIVFDAASFLRGNPWIHVLTVGGAICAFSYRNKMFNSERVQACLLRIPKFGLFLKRVSFVNAIRTLALMLKAGVDFRTAMELSGAASRDPSLTKAWKRASKLVLAGVEPWKAFEDVADEIGPDGDTLAAVMRNGEQSGSMDSVLMDQAVEYQNDLISQADSVQKMVEPMATIGMTLFAAVIAGAIYLPVVNLGKAFMVKNGRSAPPPAVHAPASLAKTK